MVPAVIYPCPRYPQSDRKRRGNFNQLQSAPQPPCRPDPSNFGFPCYRIKIAAGLPCPPKSVERHKAQTRIRDASVIGGHQHARLHLRYWIGIARRVVAPTRWGNQSPEVRTGPPDRTFRQIRRPAGGSERGEYGADAAVPRDGCCRSGPKRTGCRAEGRNAVE